MSTQATSHRISGSLDRDGSGQRRFVGQQAGGSPLFATAAVLLREHVGRVRDGLADRMDLNDL